MSGNKPVKRITLNSDIEETLSTVEKFNISTVCMEARCPNIYECFSKKHLTFIILGDICTRNCFFCAVKKGNPCNLDRDEPEKISEVVRRLKLKKAVITSVTRDDLSDGGAKHFVECIRKIRMKSPETSIEVLIPDFRDKKNAVDEIIKSCPDVIGHNIETVERLYPVVRQKASYRYSLDLIKYIKENKKNNLIIKSGMMLGLGEEEGEVIQTFKDLFLAGVEVLTVGQYLQPTGNQLKVRRYYSEKEFKYFEKVGFDIGFKKVFSGQFIRSSYI